MSLSTLEIVEVEKNDSDDDSFEHYYCECDDSIMLCGLVQPEAPDHTDVDTPPEDDCVVCIDLIDSICPRCGE